MQEALTFDDVLIEPGYSDITTRSDIDLSQEFLQWKMDIPIISANMDYVTGFDMAAAMWRAGGLGILNRFYPEDQQTRDAYELNQLGQPAILSVGTRNLAASFAQIESPYVTGVCIDIAHGHHKSVAELINMIAKHFPNKTIIAGNVATEEGFRFLASNGAHAIKVGIGPGSVCTTRTVTGIGVPQLTAIQRAVIAQRDFDSVKIIADGGIKTSGDIVKALAAGADVVMLGSLLAGTDECPGETRVAPDNSVWRPYQGQSIYGTNKDLYTPEGISGWVQSKGPVADILKQLAAGIRSGMSYVGARNLDELRAKANFVRVSSYAHIESGTRVSQTFE